MSQAPDSTFSDPERRIADLERQLAERTAERDEALAREAAVAADRDETLEQQTATAEVLQVINSSPGNLASAFDAILEKAMRLCEAAYGDLLTYDNELFHVAAAVHGENEIAERHPFPPPPGGMLDAIVRGEQVFFAEDIRENDAYASPKFRELVDSGCYRSVLCVALRKDGALVGALSIFRKEIRPFSANQIALLQNFATQAVIAMENARLITETREALEQQTATAEVLGVINRSPGNLAPVFDAILDKAMRLCEASFGIMHAVEGETLRVVADNAVPQRLREFLALNPPVLGPRISRGETTVHVADLTAEEVYQSANPARRALADLGGARTTVWVALRGKEALLGVIAMYRQEVRPFTDKQIALLQNFAAQAVIAMENARLLTETREALEQQTATAEVLGVINSSPGDLAPVFEAILEKAIRLCDAAFGLMSPFDGERFHWGAAHNVPAAYVEFMHHEPPQPSPKSALGRIRDGERVVQIEDYAQDQGYEGDDPRRRALVELGGARSYVAVGLYKDDKLIGALAVYRQELRPFSEREIAVLENCAAQAVIAMENARLLNETREALEQQTATAEVLGVINSLPGELEPVFDAILEKAHALCGVVFGTLQLYENEHFRAVATHGMPEQITSLVRRPYRMSDPDSPGGHLLAGDRFYQSDLAEEVAQSNPRAKAALEICGVRTLMFLPLRKDNQLIGMISAGRKEVRPFVEKEIALLENFAAQAVIAMENARLLDELRQRTDEVAELNRGLEARVAEQVEELGRVGRLKRFLAPQLAELIVSQGDEKILESHRREIVVVFCDLRGYTAFTETAEPEEVLDFLREYHGALGPLVSQYEGTLDQFSGDGIMVFFNDPVPIPDPAERAVKMAMAMREAAGMLIADWRERGRDLGFGAGIAQGYATLGQIGFSERSGYTAIGTVCNVAARLCAEAKDGQILLSQRVNVGLRGSVPTEQVGALALKGLTQPVVAFNVPLAASQPTLRVIEGAPDV